MFPPPLQPKAGASSPTTTAPVVGCNVFRPNPILLPNDFKAKEVNTDDSQPRSYVYEVNLEYFLASDAHENKKEGLRFFTPDLLYTAQVPVETTNQLYAVHAACELMGIVIGHMRRHPKRRWTFFIAPDKDACDYRQVVLTVGKGFDAYGRKVEHGF